MKHEYRFGPFVLSEEEKLLLRDGRMVSIAPKVLETLIALVTQRGRVTTRAALLEAVWPDSFIEEGSLTRNISILRKLLAKDFPEESPIETVSKVGYRFSVPVEAWDDAPKAEEGLRLHGLSSEGPMAGLQALAEPAKTESHTEEGAIAASRSTARLYSFKRWMWATGMTVLLLACGLLGYGYFRSIPKNQLDFARFTANTNDNRVTAAAISPDGRLVAFADADGVMLRGVNDIATHSVRTPDVRDVERLEWDPDGLHILLSGLGATGTPQLWVLSITGDAPVLLKEHARMGTFSPDGSTVAFANDSRSEVWAEGRAGNTPKRVFSGSPDDTFPMILWSADGKRLLLERHTSFHGDGRFHSERSEDEIENFHSAYLAVNIADSQNTALQDSIRIGAACLLGPGHLLFSRAEPTEYSNSTSFWRVNIDQRTSAFRSALQQVRRLDSMRLLTLNASAHSDGVAAVFSQGRPGIYVGSLHLAEGRLDDVKLLNAGEGGPHGWTADSSSVLFESNLVDHQFHIYKQNTTRHEAESLTVNMGGEWFPRLTPDGHSILFQTEASDQTRSIWRLALTGGEPVLIAQGKTVEYRCPRSGPYCVLGARLDGQGFTYWVLDPVRGKGRQLVTLPASWGALKDWDISPDGLRVAVATTISIKPAIRIAQLNSGETHVLPLSIESPVSAINWLPNGNGWIVAMSTPLGKKLLYVNLKGSAHLLRETMKSTWGVPSPDGNKLAFADQDIDSNVWLLPAAR